MSGINHLSASIVLLLISSHVTNCFVLPSFSHAYQDDQAYFRPAVYFGHHLNGTRLSLTQTRHHQPDSEAAVPDMMDYEKSYEHTQKEREDPNVDAAQRKKYPMIYGMHDRLATYLGKQSDAWYKDWKIWVGVACFGSVWAKWLIHGKDEIWWQCAVFAFGLNIIILHLLQYAPTIRMGMTIVCVLLAAQSLLLNYLLFIDSRQEAETDGAPTRFHSTGLKEADQFPADTLYLDLSLPYYQIVVLFISQFCVWWFYITSILGNFDFAHVNYTFWLVAYMSLQMTMILCRGQDSVLGNPFPVRDVYNLATVCDNMVFKQMDAEEKPFKISQKNVVMRGLTGFFSNAILREIMSFTIPLMLMGFSEPMDFVVYCVGVNFICTIDDMSDKIFVMGPKEEAETLEAPAPA